MRSSPTKASQWIVSTTEKWFRCFHFYLDIQYIFKANFLIAIYQFLFPPITSSAIWNYSQTSCFENGCFLARMLKYFCKIILCRHSSENFIEILDMRLFHYYKLLLPERFMERSESNIWMKTGTADTKTIERS